MLEKQKYSRKERLERVRVRVNRPGDSGKGSYEGEEQDEGRKAEREFRPRSKDATVSPEP
jgi:hypothetical protein